jgi:predicted dehydrogenase
MLKTAIIGCGKIADAHAVQLQRIRGCTIVGVCDREPLMAQQLFDRFPVSGCYDDVDQLLRDAQPDVVHITTPPASHFDLAYRCLEHGAHVYVEKPFTLNATDAQKLITFAEQKGLKLTVGHDDQFSHVARRMRRLVRQGHLGGAPVHMESYYCYDLSQPGYAQAILGEKEHWVRKLPGKLLHNIISHGIARIAEFLIADEPRVVAHGFVSPILNGIGERHIVDELRVIVSDQERTTAYFTFSSQMRPSLHQFRIFGPKHGLLLDHDEESLISLPGQRYKSYAQKFIPQIVHARQHAGNFTTNLKLFLANDFHMKSGMKYLIESFYRSITAGDPLPIPYVEIVRTARIMDHIFAQLRSIQDTGVSTDSNGTTHQSRSFRPVLAPGAAEGFAG